MTPMYVIAKFCNDEALARGQNVLKFDLPPGAGIYLGGLVLVAIGAFGFLFLDHENL